MKKILIFIAISMSLSLSAYAENVNECKTDIYYGNGVWNEPESAAASQLKLQTYVIEPEIIKNNPLLQVKYGQTKLAYNWGQGTLLDVLETYYQLKEAGQMEGIGFYTAIVALTVKLPNITLSAVATQKLMEPFTKDWEQGNVDEMWDKYYNESFKLGHRVLLVSHSQGNLFANRIHDKLTPAQYQDYFANFQVASPASEVNAVKGGYVTLYGDPVINPIPGSMGGNVNGSPGHAFIEAYLAQSDPYNKIVAGIKQLLPTLDSELSQWETDQELEPNTCESKITVKHRFDESIEMGEKVYPFNGSKKLYQAKNEAGSLEYVKASSGGENILSEWEDKLDSECFMIDNVEEEKIAKIRFIRDDINNIVLDTKYNTHWQDNENAESMNWYAADNYCKALELGGYDNWRLPLYMEMFDPVVYDEDSYHIDSAFENLKPALYWSGAIYDDPTSVWDIATVYHYGAFRGYEFDVRVAFGVRCVRQNI
jgi:hypothetical protein